VQEQTRAQDDEKVEKTEQSGAEAKDSVMVIDKVRGLTPFDPR
jgi:hypothetical protein